MRQRPGHSLVRAFVACALASPGFAHAANATWTASSNGAWDTSSNWSTGAAASGATSTATFGSAAGTGISINTAVTIGTLQFNSGAPAYSLAVNSNGSLTLGANGIVNNSSNPFTLTVNASARVNFEGTSSAANSILILNSGGIIDFSRSTGTITAGSLAGFASSNIYLGSRKLTVGSLNTSTLFQGVIADGGNSGGTGGSLTKVGTGTLTLDRDNTYTGTTTISAGTLQIGNGGSTGSLVSNIVNNAALVFNRGGTSTYAGVISGSGTLAKSGGGTVTLSGTNSYSGGTFLNAGSLQVAADNNLGNAASALTFNGGTLLFGGTFTSARNVTLTGAGTFNTSTFSPLFTGVVSGAGVLTKSGSGKLTLAGTNTYTGNTTVSAGTLQIGNGGTSGSIAGNASVSNGATLAFSRSDSQTYAGVISGSGSFSKLESNSLTLTGNNTYSGGTTVNGTLLITGAHTGGGTATVNSGAALKIGNGGTTGSIASAIANNGSLVFNRSDSLSYSGVISGTGTLTKLGTGTLTLSGANTFSGDTSINAGTLVITANASGGGTTTIGESSTLQLGNGGITGILSGNIVDNGLLTFNRSDSFTFGGDISGSGSLVKYGAGTLTLTGTLSYAGTTTILGGSLLIGTGGTTGGLVGDLVINSALTFNRVDDYLYAGVISGTGSFNKLGAGTLTFTGANLYTGGTTITEGTLQLGNSGTTGSLVGPVVLAGGTLAFDRSDYLTFGSVVSGSGALVKKGAGTLELTGLNTFTGTTSVLAGTLKGTTQSLHGPIVNNGTVYFNQDSAGTFADSISGSGALAKQGSKLTLTGASTYLGATSFVGDVDLIGTGASLNGTSGISLAPIASFAQATFRVADASVVTPGALVVGDTGTAWFYLSGTGTAQTASAVLGASAGSNGSALITSTAPSAWINTGALVVGGSGTGSLTVENGSTLQAGSIVLSQQAGSYGTLSIGLGASSAAINTASVTGGVGNTGLVSFYTSDSAYTFAPVLAGNLSVEQIGESTTTLTGANTYTGGTFVRKGRLYGNTSSLRGAIVNETVVRFDQTADGTFAGSMSGSGSLVAQGSRLIVTGVNTYTGATTIGGAIDVTGGVINGTSRIDIASAPSTSASLSLNGSLSTVRTTGSLKVGQSGAGTLSVTGGSLLTSADGALGVSAGASGTATVSGTGSLWSNTGALTIGSGGSGVLTVSNGGVVAASNILLGDTSGSTGVLNIGAGGDAGTVNAATISGGPGTSSVLNFNHAESAYAVSAQLGGNLAVNQIGPGKTILTAANNYTGLTTISGGTLQIGDGGTSGSLVGDILNNGTLLFNRSDDVTFGGAISGTGSLIKDGAGTLTLTGSVTYTGTTTVLGGALLIGTGGTSGNWDGDLDISSTLTFNRSDNIVYSHVVSGSGSLIKTGTGTLTLTNANTYTGGTVISVGTLQVGNGGTTGSILGNVSNNANLAFNRVDDVTFGGTISGTGTLTKLGAGTLTLTGSNTYTGGTSIVAGTLQVGDGGTTGALTGNVSNGSALVFNRAGTMSYSGAISGSGTFSKTGSGTLNLTGNNTYTGATSLVGNVNVMSGGRIEGTSAIAVAAGASQSGVLRVSGVGSRVTTAGTITVGGLGSGTLTIDDGGTVNASSILLGAETGSTGILNIGSGAAAGALNAATVVDGAGVGSAVNLNFTDVGYTLASNLLHTLTVNQNGPGTTILTGVNSYTGGTHLNAGTLRVKSNSNLGGAASALYFNGGTLQWDATVTNLPRSIVLEAGGGTIDTGTFSVTSTGVISGSGNLTKAGSGILSLTGANTYTGNLTVSAGTLRGTSTSLRGDILNNGSVEFLQTASGTYAGVMSGSGSLTKQNAGNLTLSGANTYTGSTTVSSGTLTVSGSLASPTTVGVSGVLAGTGTIGGNIAVSGVLAPGNAATAPFGTLTVNGNISFASGSTLRVQTDELGQNSKINVVGAGHGVTISGGTVEVLTGGGEYNAHTAYTLISSAGAVTGSFAQVTTDFAFLTPALTYDANHVNLTLDRNDLAFAAFAQTASASSSAVAAAEYLDAAPAEQKLVRGITMLNATQASDAFEDLSGSSLTDMTRVSMSNTTRLFEMLASRLGTQDAGDGTGLAFSTLKTDGPRSYSSSAATAVGSGLWVRQFVTGASVAESGGGDSKGLHTAVGLDAVVNPQTTVGLSAIYTRDYVDLDNGRSRRSQARTPQLAAYVNHTFDAAEVRAVAGCGTHRYDTVRVVAAGAGSSLVSAQRSGQECSAYVQAEMGDGANPTPLRPIVGLMYSRLNEPGYVERGGPAALAVDGHSTDSVLSHAGLRYAWSSSDERVSFEGRAVWSHQFAGNDAGFRASLADATDSRRFRVRAPDTSRDSFVVGTGVAAALRGGFSFHADYNLQLDASRRADHALVASFRYVH